MSKWIDQVALALKRSGDQDMDYLRSLARDAIAALRDIPDDPGPLYEAGEYSRRNVDCMVNDFLEG